MGYICMYVDELHSGQVTVLYISAHTGHEFRSTRSSPPQKCEISMKMSMGCQLKGYYNERVLQAGINLRGGGGGTKRKLPCVMMSLAVQHLLITC